jgi:hypothetical protein
VTACSVFCAVGYIANDVINAFWPAQAVACARGRDFDRAVRAVDEPADAEEQQAVWEPGDSVAARHAHPHRVCTTNRIESINARIPRAVNACGHFPTEAAAPKCVYLSGDHEPRPDRPRSQSAGPTVGRRR